VPALNVTLNTTGWVRGLDRLLERAPQAVIRAMNRATTAGRVVMVREVARDLGLRQGDITDTIAVRSAAMVGRGQFTAAVIATGRRIPLSRWRVRQTRRGVTANLPGGAGQYPGAFLATMSSGHRGVFRRTGGPRRRGPRGQDLPIRELFGPSVPHVFERYLPLGVARAEAQLATNLVHELRFALRAA
jgi:hypothetical protein